MSKPANAAPEITPEQIRAWKHREEQRMYDGAYTPLPPFWTDAIWWRYGVKDQDAYFAKRRALVDAGGCYPQMYSVPHQNHFAHVSTTDGAMIAFTENDAKGVADRQTKMKPGKYLQKFFGDVLTPEQVRDIATAFCAEYAPQEIKFASTADDIEHVYTHGPNSCMSHGASGFASSCHPVRVYGDSDLQVAYIAPQPDRITARAICWPAKKRYGRIYGDTARIEPLLKEAGYKEGSMEGARVRAIHDDDRLVMPYVDNICWGELDGEDWVRLGSGEIELQRAGGLTDTHAPYTCECCGNGMREDGAYSVEGVDGYYCAECESEHTVTCDRSSYRLLREDVVEMYDGNYWSQRSFDLHGFTCPITNENYDRRDGIDMADGETWSRSAFDDGGFTCAGTGQNYSRAELVVMADGALWSQEHFDAFGHVDADGANVRDTDAPLDARPYRCPDTLEMTLNPPVPNGEIGVGSTVIVDPSFYDWPAGMVGTVVEKTTYDIRVRFDDARERGHGENDDTWWIAPGYLRLVSPAPALFNPGDLVECTGNVAGQFSRGSIYTVSAVNHDMIMVARDDRGSTNNGWHRDNFRLWLPSLRTVAA